MVLALSAACLPMAWPTEGPLPYLCWEPHAGLRACFGSLSNGLIAQISLVRFTPSQCSIQRHCPHLNSQSSRIRPGPQEGYELKLPIWEGENATERHTRRRREGVGNATRDTRRRGLVDSAENVSILTFLPLLLFTWVRNNLISQILWFLITPSSETQSGQTTITGTSWHVCTYSSQKEEGHLYSDSPLTCQEENSSPGYRSEEQIKMFPTTRWNQVKILPLGIGSQLY